MVFLLEGLLLILREVILLDARSVAFVLSAIDQERLPALCLQATFVFGPLYARSFTSFRLTDVDAAIVRRTNLFSRQTVFSLSSGQATCLDSNTSGPSEAINSIASTAAETF